MADKAQQQLPNDARPQSQPGPLPCICDNAVDHEVPVFRGRGARRLLTTLWGLPDSAPRTGESLFGSCRVLFKDDWNDGRPLAYWIPEGDEDLRTDTLDARVSGFSVQEVADVTQLRVPHPKGETVVLLSTRDQVHPLALALSKCGEPEPLQTREGHLVEQFDIPNIDAGTTEYGELLAVESALSTLARYVGLTARAMRQRSHGSVDLAVSLELAAQRLYERLPQAWRT